jgi:hypothetical protein
MEHEGSWFIGAPILGTYAYVHYRDGVVEVGSTPWNQNVRNRTETQTIVLADPASLEMVTKWIKDFKKKAMKDTTWHFTRLAVFWISVVMIISWLIYVLSSENGYSKPRRMMHSTVNSVNFERTTEIIDEVVATIEVDPQKPTTTVLFGYDRDEDILVYHNRLRHWRQKMETSAKETADLPYSEAFIGRSMILNDYRTEMFHMSADNRLTHMCPAGIARYPYNRHIFAYFICGLIILGVSLFLNRHWFN